MNFKLAVAHPEGQDYHYERVRRPLCAKLSDIVKRNPRGFKDEIDSRFENICCDVAVETGARVSFADYDNGVEARFVFGPFVPVGWE